MAALPTTGVISTDMIRAELGTTLQDGLRQWGETIGIYSTNPAGVSMDSFRGKRGAYMSPSSASDYNHGSGTCSQSMAAQGGNTDAFLVSNATYTWSISGLASIVSGQGTKAVLISQYGGNTNHTSTGTITCVIRVTAYIYKVITASYSFRWEYKGGGGGGGGDTDV